MRSVSRFLIFTALLISIFSIASFAQSPHGPNLKIDCASCHIPTNWKVIPRNIKFNHDQTSFSLIGQHKNVPCQSCHTTLIFSQAKTDCFSCHKDIHQGTVGYDCQRCHSPQSWVVNNINELHEEYRFPLVGAHLNADCIQCHAGYADNTFEAKGTTCFDCHKNNFNSTTAPNHIQAGFSTNCAECHNVNAQNWTTTTFNHDFFPLVGGHKIANCFDCHKSGSNFSGLSADCYSCHKTNYDNAKNPDHSAGNFSTDCKSCHTIMGWSPATFDHNKTSFPLTGKHVTVDCQSCHKGNYSNIPTDCYSCHQADFQGTTDPNHVAQGFSTDCSQCHNTNGWGDANFNHDNTGFPLTGKHVTTSCSSCHTNGYSTPPPTDCYSCHQTNFNNTTDPPHVSQNISHDCSTCHTTDGWTPANFDHSFYPLGSHHTNLNCSQCHSQANYQPDCLSCHQSDFNNGHNPGDPTDCWNCHNTSQWGDSNFDHSTTGFSLTGTHATITCAQCHTGGYTNTPSDCYSCHETDFNNATDPNHATLGYPHDCSQCHTTIDWSNANFDHNTTGFPLTGAHTSVTCIQCHANGYTNTPTDCYSCHQTNYDNSSNPNHQSIGISTDCQSCHTTNPGWTPATFSQHNQFFELTGAHLNITNCDNCHNGNYVNPPNTCYGCHQTDFENTTDPPHVSQNLSHDCTTCHTTSGWTPATFDHSFYPLGSHHINLNCSQCHSQPNYGPDCLSCHQSDFDQGHNQGDPTTCWDCHNTSDWSNASFNHNDYWPLTGAHTTVACTQCHVNGYSNTPTDCYSCHQTNYDNTTNPDHQSLSISTDCQTCHTTNPGWTPATFPQHNQYFELTGAHLNITNCDDCHNGNYVNPPNTCYGCHQTDFQNTTDPPHVSLNFSHDCTTCHTTNGWTPATFDHSFYSLASPHNSFNCSECHSQPNYQPDCLSCHQNDFNQGHNPGDRTDCWNCHSTSHFGDGPIMKRKRINFN